MDTNRQATFGKSVGKKRRRSNQRSRSVPLERMKVDAREPNRRRARSANETEPVEFLRNNYFRIMEQILDEIYGSIYKMRKLMSTKRRESIGEYLRQLMALLRKKRELEEERIKMLIERVDLTMILETEEGDRRVEIDPRAIRALLWLMKTISSIKDVLSSEIEGDIDDERCNSALMNLNNEMTGWLAEVFGIEDSTNFFPPENVKYGKKVDQYEVERVPVVEPIVPEPSQKMPVTLRRDIFVVEDDEVSLFAVDVNFILPTGENFNRAYKSFCPIEVIAQDIGHLFTIPGDQILILFKGNQLNKNVILQEMNVNPGDSVEFELRTIDPLRYRLSNKAVIKPDKTEHRIIAVEADEEDVKQVKVLVETWCMKKPFVGGYRHKETGIEYHDGFSQTHPRTLRCKNKTDRDTQTACERSKGQNTTVEKSTQNYRRDLYLPDFFECILTSKSYITAEECERMRDLEGKVRTIQRYYRAYVLRKKIKGLAAEYRRKTEIIGQKIRDIEEEKLNREKYDIIRRLYPRTKTDFEILYIMIEHWRRKEEEAIKENFSLPAQPAERCELLNKEVGLLKLIDQQRIQLQKEKKASQEVAFLDKCSKPVEWTNDKGLKFSMDTMETQRARDLREMYHSFCRDQVSTEERIELLMSLKYALAIYNERSCNELITLLERETELLLAGMTSKDIDFLRKRIKMLFLEILKDPQINPASAKYVSMSSIRKQKRRFCPFCKIMHDTSKYFNCFIKGKAKKCPTCDWVVIGRRREFSEPYREILRALQREEVRRSCHASLAFIMQPEDIHYLMCHIWYAASVISDRSDISQLRLPRWDVHREWAPWNCFPITKDEEKWHLKQACNEDVYYPDFIEFVEKKNGNAKLFFKQHYRLEKIMFKEDLFIQLPNACSPPET